MTKQKAAMYKLIVGRPGLTLADLLRRVVTVSDAKTASRLAQEGWVTRDQQGRYTPGPVRPRGKKGLCGEAGHGRVARMRPADGLALRHKRLDGEEG